MITSCFRTCFMHKCDLGCHVQRLSSLIFKAFMVSSCMAVWSKLGFVISLALVTLGLTALAWLWLSDPGSHSLERYTHISLSSKASTSTTSSISVVSTGVPTMPSTMPATTGTMPSWICAKQSVSSNFSHRVAVVVRVPSDPTNFLCDLLATGLFLVLYCLAEDPVATKFALHNSGVIINSTVPNRGLDVSKYVAFLVHYYDNLPETMLFIHGHTGAWHDPPKKLDVSLEAMQVTERTSDIVHLRWPDCTHYALDVAIISQSNWKLLFEDALGTQPAALNVASPYLTPCCSQFAVVRTAVLQHPKSYYEGLYKFMFSQDSYGINYTDENNLNRIKAQILERVWTLALTQCRSGRSSRNQCPAVFRKGNLCDPCSELVMRQMEQNMMFGMDGSFPGPQAQSPRPRWQDCAQYLKDNF